MGAHPQEVKLAIEPWDETHRPLLARLYRERAAHMERVIDAVKAGHALLYVARREGAVQGVLVVAVEKLLAPAVYVVAMVTVPKSGFAWGPALWPALRAHWKKEGAELVRAEARSEANRRRLARLGFEPSSTMMVAPC